MSHLDEALPYTRALLPQIVPFTEVDWGAAELSENPLVSIGYQSCRGFVGMYGSLAGVNHIGRDDDPERLMEALRSGFPGRPRGYILGGSGTEELARIAESLDFDVMDAYAGTWHSAGEQGGCSVGRFDLIVMPSLREMLLVTARSQLHKRNLP